MQVSHLEGFTCVRDGSPCVRIASGIGAVRSKRLRWRGGCHCRCRCRGPRSAGNLSHHDGRCVAIAILAVDDGVDVRIRSRSHRPSGRLRLAASLPSVARSGRSAEEAGRAMTACSGERRPTSGLQPSFRGLGSARATHDIVRVALSTGKPSRHNDVNGTSACGALRRSRGLRRWSAVH